MRILMCLTVYILFTSTAYGYLDPATGSLIIQTVIALVAGGLITLKTYRIRIVEYFKNRKKKKLDEKKEQKNKADADLESKKN